jgi:hypothetical protein
LLQLTSEYRALRATVFRLWMHHRHLSTARWPATWRASTRRWTRPLPNPW